MTKWPPSSLAEQLTAYLKAFERIIELYRAWSQQTLHRTRLAGVIARLPKRTTDAIAAETERRSARTVFDAYNVATDCATHQTRSVWVAFELLARINRRFQESFRTAA